MKKVLGITFGGLRDKLIRLVLIILAVTIVVFAILTTYQNRSLTEIVGDTRQQQQQAISDSTEATMSAVLEDSLIESTVLRAKIADNDFAEVVNNVYMLQSMAQGLFENRDKLEKAEVGLPDASLDGQVSAMVLCEEGVDYTTSEYLGIVGHMSSTLIAMCRNSDKIESCYIGLSDGTDLCVDDKAANKLDANGNPIPFPVTQRPWYQGASRNGRLYFTELMKDAFSGKVLITCSAPVFADQKVAGVVGIDIVLENMDDFVLDTNGTHTSIYIINNLGHIVLSSGNNELLEQESKSSDLRRSENKEFAAQIARGYKETTELALVNLGGEPYYMAGAPLRTMGWSLVTVVEKELTEQPGKLLLSEFEQINEEASETFQAGTAKINRAAIFTALALVLLGALAAVGSARRIVNPIEQMTRNVVKTERGGHLFEMQDSYRTHDEIELLAEAFEDLSQRTKRYIEDITQITREKERVSTELHMANQIQESMLPNIYPAFPERPEFDIYASMNPAREVGGDFYDYFLVDDDHLCMVMADVSGKGVPAALFMMASKIILANNAMMGKSPAKILEDANNAICQNNKMEMFVTVWLGILEISTGKLVAANAGHEYPAIRRAGGKYELFRDRHGFVIGGMTGARYQEYELKLAPGDSLFVYTDGVPEATNAEKELFGTKRMLGALNVNPDGAPEEMMKQVEDSVSDFVREAEQFDDLTMLCMKYCGPNA